MDLDFAFGLMMFLVGFATLAGIASVTTLGLNINWGMTGLFNIGIAGFYAVGAYTSAILGGLGRPYGAVAGGMIIGMLEELSVLAIPGDYKSAVAFAAMVLVLIFRPQGIFKGRVL